MSIEAPPLDQTATTIQIRQWILTDVKELLEMLVTAGSARILPPDLIELVTVMQKTLLKSNDQWPRWLVIGVAVRLGLQSAKEALSAGPTTGSPRAKLLRCAARLLRDGVPTAVVLSNQTPEAFRAYVASVGLDEELRELNLVSAERYSIGSEKINETVSVVIFDRSITTTAGSTKRAKS